MVQTRKAVSGWLTAQPIAHRGLHGPGAPENSLPAFELACAAGYPIELDIQVLRDGEVVVFHDQDLWRAAGVARDLEQEDRSTIGRHRLFGTKHRIPTLRQVLACVAGSVPILLEVKSRRYRPEIGPKVTDELAGYSGELALQSFNPQTLAWFRKHAPHLRCGQLAGPLRENELSPVERFACQRLLTCAISRPDFLNYDLHGLPDLWVEWVTRRLGLPLLCWTVRSETDRRKAESLGLNFVFDHIRP